MKAFEDHQRRQGKTVSHGTAKEVLAGLAVDFTVVDFGWYQGVAMDRMIENKGLNYLDAYVPVDPDLG